MNRILKLRIFLAFLILAVIVLLIFLNSRGALNPIKRFMFDLTIPFQRFFKIISNKVLDFIRLISSIRNLNRENQFLKGENERLLSDIIRLSGVDKENETLRNELNLLPRDKYNFVSAFIVSFDQGNLTKAFIIDKGEKDGVKEGMPVIVSNGVLVGRIKEVSNHSAKVLLIIDGQSHVDGKIEKNEARGIVRGKYGLGLSMENISQDVEIKRGDLVVTSGKSGELPDNLIIGNIQQTYSVPNDIFQKADIIPEANFSELRTVSVIINKRV